MDIKEYIQNPCRMLSIPYWKAINLTLPDTVKIVHASEWNGQYKIYERFFRIKHSLQNFATIDFDYNIIAIDNQTKQLADMINASYVHENIVVSEEEILRWKEHKTFRENLWVCIETSDGKMVASGIAEYDEECKEGILEWVQVLPEYRGMGFGKKIVIALLNELKKIGAEFATVSGNLDNVTTPLELYKKCGFFGEDVWYICRVV